MSNNLQDAQRTLTLEILYQLEVSPSKRDNQRRTVSTEEHRKNVDAEQ
jgi:hypothetical protein